MNLPASDPVLTCEQSRALEERLFQGDESAEWAAMRQAGAALAAAVLRDFDEIGGFPAAGRILVLAGKGHNGGDALIAAHEILRRFPAGAGHGRLCLWGAAVAAPGPAGLAGAGRIWPGAGGGRPSRIGRRRL